MTILVKKCINSNITKFCGKRLHKSRQILQKKSHKLQQILHKANFFTQIISSQSRIHKFYPSWTQFSKDGHIVGNLALHSWLNSYL